MYSNIGNITDSYMNIYGLTIITLINKVFNIMDPMLPNLANVVYWSGTRNEFSSGLAHPHVDPLMITLVAVIGSLGNVDSFSPLSRELK